MRVSVFASACAAYASVASATINWTLDKAANPTADQLDAYTKIEAAMTAAAARYAKWSTASKDVKVAYAPGVPTAEASYNGDLRFGENRANMNERVALHEIAHTLGIGQTSQFNDRCAANNWPGATALLKTWDGADAKINCGGGHIWPYGLNYDTEFSETNADRHCQLINAMIADGMQGAPVAMPVPAASSSSSALVPSSTYESPATTTEAPVTTTEAPATTTEEAYTTTADLPTATSAAATTPVPYPTGGAISYPTGGASPSGNAAPTGRGGRGRGRGRGRGPGRHHSWKPASLRGRPSASASAY
ncbi:metallopeptidase-like protein 1 [Elsinoe australis]|uniref:Metallopeptidase-like protein 1 n=1 Tax=Elsinoe australis TaxID=40998 RepID=A0A4U7AXR5_9PEZI|nr:metallopeptidase-like protein 1 [Elsinoe australis]